MKKDFSVAWISSKQRRKQRKYRENAPLHIKHKFMSANLSKDLRKKNGKRNLPVKKGDSVKVMRGKFAGKQGKISHVDLNRERVSIEGLQVQKKDGTKVNVYFHPSKIQITELAERTAKTKPEEKKENKEKKQNA